MLVGGLGAGALLALPDLSLAGRSVAKSVASDPAVTGSSAARYVFVFGVPETTTTGGSLAAAMSPAAKAANLPAPKAVAAQLAVAPVSSPDGTSVALVTVDNVATGAKVTLTVVDSATAVIQKQGSLLIPGVADDLSIIATPVFVPGSTTIALVLGVTEATDKKMAVKLDRQTGHKVPFQAVTWRSHHELTYFDTSTGKFSELFSLNEAPQLALHTVAANSSDLLLWTTAEPQPGQGKGTPVPVPTLSVIPIGSGTARIRKTASLPWPGGEPVTTLANGDVARLVKGRIVQVASAQTGEITQTTLEPLSKLLAKPSAVTMATQSDGTVFIAKAGAGVAVVVDPLASFKVKSQVNFPAPPNPGSAPWSKAVLNATGDSLYVLGGKSAAGVSVYDVSTGKLAGSYSQGEHYTGLHLLPNGHLLATSPSNPRLTFFSPELGVLGTATTNVQIASVF
jgi:hypothetical protein